jgi:hypothetical protein
MISTKLKDWVKLKLIENPKLRDSNERLYYEYLKSIDYDVSVDVKQFLKDMASREIKYLDSIARASRLIQEENPYLRGKTWKKRKEKSVKVKYEILSIKEKN